MSFSTGMDDLVLSITKDLRKPEYSLEEITEVIDEELDKLLSLYVLFSGIKPPVLTPYESQLLREAVHKLDDMKCGLDARIRKGQAK